MQTEPTSKITNEKKDKALEAGLVRRVDFNVNYTFEKKSFHVTSV
jgi:hypothetical protein